MAAAPPTHEAITTIAIIVFLPMVLADVLELSASDVEVGSASMVD